MHRGKHTYEYVPITCASLPRHTAYGSHERRLHRAYGTFVYINRDCIHVCRLHQSGCEFHRGEQKIRSVVCANARGKAINSPSRRFLLAANVTAKVFFSFFSTIQHEKKRRRCECVKRFSLSIRTRIFSPFSGEDILLPLASTQTHGNSI